MGKIRIKGFDEASAEDEAKLKAKKEAKKADKIATKNAVRAAQGKKINPQSETSAVTKTEEKDEMVKDVHEDELVIETIIPEENTTPVIARSNNDETISEKTSNDSKASEAKSASGGKGKKEKFVTVKIVGVRHKENMAMVSKNQTYNIDQALLTLKKFKKSKFDESVELHINTKEKGVSGQVTLPHGTGKTLVIKIADDAILAEVAKGKISFDILVATPGMMPQLAKVAKVLGPRGLMPNPKNGTITDKPEEAVKKLSGGQINYKTESASPIIHALIGKISFEDSKLRENVTTFIASVGSEKIKSVILKSTMSPAVKLDYLSL